ncbi:phage portal protein [Streptomyces sp. NPDC005096]|uniref:phage portal protein n=1 Tax=Streptomyces sp. NPDC005096 TaxID=3154559 RepID=UPI0033BF8178
MSDLTNAVNQILDKRADYETAQQYYEGAVEEVFFDRRIRRALKRTGDHFRLNYAATPVNAVNNRLEIASVSAISDGANSYLDRVWASNELELEVGQVHKNALIYGDAYLIVWPDGESLQIFYNTAKNAVVVYDEENPRLKRYAAKVWSVTVDGKSRSRVNLYYADHIEKYITVSRLGESPADKDFVPFRDEHTDSEGVMPNPLGFVPVFHFRTEHPEGKPEHLLAYNAQDMINKLAITQMAVNDFHGFPQRWALAGEGSTEAADFDTDDDEEKAEALGNNPGDMLWLSNVDKVGQFPAADPDNFLKPMKHYIRSLAVITDTPVHYFEPTGNIPSGEALRTAEAPLVKKVRTRQISFGATWREVFTAILVIGGFKEDVQVHWKSIETFDTKESWEIAYKKQQTGLPFAQNMAEMGYDKALVEQWDADRKAQEASQGGSQGSPGSGSTPVQPADTQALDDSPSAGEQKAA